MIIPISEYFSAGALLANTLALNKMMRQSPRTATVACLLAPDPPYRSGKTFTSETTHKRQEIRRTRKTGGARHHFDSSKNIKMIASRQVLREAWKSGPGCS
jgi:hypothetical protein